MADQKRENSKSLIARELNIEGLNMDQLDEEDFLRLISRRVLEMMEYDLDLLFSYLYRLDIDEGKINFIINRQDSMPAHMGLAKLILTRQKERMESKKKYKQDKIEGWDEY